MESFQSDKILSLVRQLETNSPEEVKKLLNHLEDMASNASNTSQDQVTNSISKHLDSTNNLNASCISDIPTYEQLFCAPKKSLREHGKLYGRAYLKTFHPEQNQVLQANYRLVARWLKNEQAISDLRHNKEGKNSVESIIKHNYHELKPLVFRGMNSVTTYDWRIDDVYSWYVKSAQSKRKNKKLACGKSDSSTSLAEDNKTKTHPLEDNENNIFTLSQNDIGSSSYISPNILLDQIESNNKIYMEDVYRPDLPPIDLINEEKDVDEDESFDMDAHIDVLHTKSFTELLASTEGPIQSVEKKSDDSKMHDSTVARKSSRVRKVTTKLQEQLEERQATTPIIFKPKRQKGNVLVEDASTCSGSSQPCLVTQYCKIDQETILMKYLGALSIEAMYQQLKPLYSMMRKEGILPSMTKNPVQSCDGMREEVLKHLLQKGRVTIARTRIDRVLSLSDVSLS